MPNPFAVSALSNSVRLDSNRRGEASFTVSNNSGRTMRMGARLEVARPAVAPAVGTSGSQVPPSPDPGVVKWLTFVDDSGAPSPPAGVQYAERELKIGGTQQFKVRIIPPPTAPQGTYSFYVHFTDVLQPDEEFNDSPIVTLEIPAPAKKAFPIWIPIVAAVAVLVIAALAVFVVVSSTPEPTPTPTPTTTVATTTVPTTTVATTTVQTTTAPTTKAPTTSTVLPGDEYIGTWLNDSKTVSGITKIIITRVNQTSVLTINATLNVAPTQLSTAVEFKGAKGDPLVVKITSARTLFMNFANIEGNKIFVLDDNPPNKTTNSFNRFELILYEIPLERIITDPNTVIRKFATTTAKP